METKEAIEFVEFELSRYRNPDFVMDKEDIKNESIMKGIIALLQQGEAYRRMWKEFDDEYGVHGFEIEDTYFRIRNLMEKIEQKYFPKEK